MRDHRFAIKHDEACSSIPILLKLLCLLLIFVSSAGAQLRQTRRVLLINDLGIVSSPGFAEVDQAIFSALQNSPYQIELYQESLQLTFFPDEASQLAFRESLIHKYSQRKPDLIIAAGSASLKFVAESQESLIRDTPVVFCAVLGDISDEIKSRLHVTGVLGRLQPEETLRAALHLLPGTTHVVVVGGMGKFDEGWERIAKQAFQNYESKLDFTYLTDLTMPDLLDRLRHLPSNTIVYHTSIAQDAAGRRFIGSAQSVPLIASAANAPVFVMDNVDLRAGTVGGSLVNWSDDGRVAGEIAVRILNGERPQDIPIVMSNNVYMFDWRALKRWGLKESNLPPGSVVLNRQATFWELYKRYVITGISLILLEAFLIFALLVQRARRRDAENTLAVTNDRLRTAIDSGKFVGWDFNVKAGENHWFGDLQGMFGIPSHTYSADLDEFRKRVHPEDRDAVIQAIEKAKETREPYVAEFRVNRDDGEVRWIIAQGKFRYSSNGIPERMLGLAVDMTDRRRAQELIQESEERFRLVANTAPVLIWMSDTDKLCTYVNKTWLDFRGRPLDAELGNGWTEGIHPEDITLSLNTYIGAFDRREPFNMRYRIRRHDGEYRWLLDIGVPRFNPDGSFAGYIGSCVDVTERKLAEDAMTTLSARLIEAQEEERKRIARELHDDYNQRLAMTAIDLERLAENIGDSSPDAVDKLYELFNRVSEVGADLHSLSHSLHSSTLESLGLVAGVKGFCKEFAEQQGIQVDFAHENVPRGIPGDAALCMFRIAQEALRNVKKHSGAARAEVRLEWLSEKLHLSITDSGKGFDLTEPDSDRGIGVHSMEERLRVLGGRLEITSHPMQGTRVDAWLPFNVARQHAS